MDHQQQRTDEEATGEAAEAERQLTPASSNPWYILATIHGEQTREDVNSELHARNRRSWNRWMAAALDQDARKSLIEKHGIDPEDIRPFEPHEVGEIEQLTADRRAFQQLALPDPGNPENPADIHFGWVDFAEHMIADGFVFPGQARLNHANFRGLVEFDGAIFRGRVSFNRTTFRDRAWFDGATFRGLAGFHGATFRDLAWFSGATFRGKAGFEGATFRSLARFEGATFRAEAVFRDATFRKLARFEGATFRHRVSFNRATFRDRAQFDGATFRDRARFDDATVRGLAGFGHAKFASTTSFDGARFRRSPDFRDAKFPFSTTWRGVFWPPPLRRTAKDDAEHYAYLRHAMDAAKRPDAELLFFVHEMRAKRYTDIPLLQKLAINVHLGLSEGGRSFGRPALAWLLAFVLAFLIEGAALAPGVFAIPSPLAFEVLRLTLGSAIVIGVPMFDPRKLEQLRMSLPQLTGQPKLPVGTSPLPDWLQMLGIAHAGFSALCLFLMALAIRNWLRLR